MTLSFPQAIGTWAIALAIFLVIDLLWLGIVARSVYVHFMGDMLASPPRWPIAFLFYGLFVAGLVYFAVAPALAAGSWTDALLKGALYGLFTYATYDLTAYAVMQDYPGALVPIDIAWGIVLAGSVSVGTYLVTDRLFG